MSETVGYLIGIFCPILSLVGLILLWKCVSRHVAKKKAIKAIKKEWNNAVISYSFSNKKKRFQDFYTELFEEVDRKAILRSISDISNLKYEYENSLKDLSLIRDDNTVFFSSPQEYNDFEENTEGFDGIDKNDIITRDVIKTLPCLAEFVDIHNDIMEKNYQLLQVDHVCFSCWRSLNPRRYYSDNNKDFVNSAYSSCLEIVGYYYKTVMEQEWKEIIKKHPQYGMCRFETIYSDSIHDPQGFDKWCTIWVEQLEAIAQDDVCVSAQRDLGDFLEDMNVKYDFFEQDLLGLSLGEYSSFHIGKLTDYNKEEIMRIYELYVSGRMRGRYYKETDPKYRNH